MLAAALEALPIAFRSVFILYELEEMTTAEIALTLALPAGTVASRLRRARELFKKTIEEMQQVAQSRYDRGATDWDEKTLAERVGGNGPGEKS